MSAAPTASRRGRRRRHARSGPWRFRRGVRASLGTLPKVGAEAALLECAVDMDVDEVFGLMSTALDQRRTTVTRLRQMVLAANNYPRRGMLLEVLAETEFGVESPLELRYLRDVERAHGLPQGIRQRSHSVGTRTDVSYPEFRTLVELDGRVHHQGLAAHVDMGRDNGHRLQGLFTLRYGWVGIATGPCLVASQVADGLQLGGWDDQPGRCHRCPPDLDPAG